MTDQFISLLVGDGGILEVFVQLFQDLVSCPVLVVLFPFLCALGIWGLVRQTLLRR